MKNKLMFLFILSFLLSSCAMYQLERNLDPDSKEFLSEVRYTIKKQERKIFLNLPPSERPGFMEEFWQKRDPNPDTEENEFKDQYYGRIEEANRLFKQGSTPGWLQDRGMVYITLGQPTNRETYPRGMHQHGFPTEIWYYGFFPVVFVDENWSGNYRMNALSAQQINEINRAQIDWGAKVPDRKIVFDFEFNMRKVKEGEAVFEIEVPYTNIWFAENDDLMQTTLEVILDVVNEENSSVWEYRKGYDISIPNEKIGEYIGEKYRIEIPVAIKLGDFVLTMEIENKTGGERVRKTFKFTL
ncbi:GWxTD domain-containing protein [Acidobacteriota bacterium]